MTLSTHVAVAGAVMRLVPDPTAQVAINIVIHPLLDLIPHAEWSTFYNKDNRSRFGLAWAGLSIVIDLLVTIFVLWLTLTRLPYGVGQVAVVMIAATWIDWLHPLIGWFWPAFVRWHISLHSWPEPAHRLINWDRSVTGRTPLWVKLLVQLALTAGSIGLIYTPW